MDAGSVHRRGGGSREVFAPIARGCRRRRGASLPAAPDSREEARVRECQSSVVRVSLPVPARSRPPGNELRHPDGQGAQASTADPVAPRSRPPDRFGGNAARANGVDDPYAAGLRVPEVCAVQVGDIESAADRMCLKFARAKAARIATRCSRRICSRRCGPTNSCPAGCFARLDRTTSARHLREASGVSSTNRAEIVRASSTQRYNLPMVKHPSIRFLHLYLSAFPAEPPTFP